MTLEAVQNAARAVRNRFRYEWLGQVVNTRQCPFCGVVYPVESLAKDCIERHERDAS